MEGYTRIERGANMADKTPLVEYTTERTMTPKMTSREATQSNTIQDQRSELARTEIRENIPSVSHIGVSHEASSSDALVRLSTGPVQFPPSEAERRITEANRLSIESSRLEPIAGTAQNRLRTQNMTAGQLTVTAGLPMVAMAIGNGNFDSESTSAISTQEQPRQIPTTPVSVEPTVIPSPPDANIKDTSDVNIGPILDSFMISTHQSEMGAQMQYTSDTSLQLTSSTNAEGTTPDSRQILHSIANIKKEKCPDSEIISPPGQFDESPVGDFNEVELSEYQWSNDQGLQLEGNVSQDYEAVGDLGGQHNWEGQTMLEVVSYESGEPVYSADAEGDMSDVNFCINSVRGDVPWGSDNDREDTMDTAERERDGRPIRRGRGRGRGVINYLALPTLRQKNRAGTADGNYSLNSNVRGLIAWLSHSKGPYTLTITQLGYKVLEEAPDTDKNIFTCELCKVNCSDVDTFYRHCRDKEHIANKAMAIQMSLKLYVRQKVAKSQAKNKNVNSVAIATNRVSTEGKNSESNLAVDPNLHGQSVHRGGYHGGRRGRRRPSKSSYDGRLQFTQKRKVYQTHNPLLPKRGRGRPRKIQPGHLLVGGVTEGNQPLQTAMSFDKTKAMGEEDKRILRVKPLPRQEEGITHSEDIDSTNFFIDNAPCDRDRPLSLTVPDSVVHTSPVGISPKRASFDQGETTPGHSLEPRRKRQRYSTETPQESDGSSTSASARSHHLSRRDLMDSPRNEIHSQNSSPGEVIKRGRGRPRKVHSGSMRGSPLVCPVAKASAPLGVSPGMSNAEDLPVQIIKVERKTPDKKQSPRKERVELSGPSSTITSSSSFGRKERVEPAPPSTITSSSSGRKERAEPGPSSTVTSSASFGNEELLNSLTDNQLWEELLERKTVHACTCGYAFSTSSAFYLHRACHNTVNEKKCSFCGLEAANWMMFHSHFFNHEAPT